MIDGSTLGVIEELRYRCEAADRWALIFLWDWTVTRRFFLHDLHVVVKVVLSVSANRLPWPQLYCIDARAFEWSIAYRAKRTHTCRLNGTCRLDRPDIPNRNSNLPSFVVDDLIHT